ncbi:hypothetical protein [Streptomyces malaysiensis]|uniref:hypothetical protein n=1 Tax=Streptomyces malaysiensis TaxID=92644 RepID=UPI00142ED38F|nr:hypothetical protein [Streptomyces malaysiensis]
MPRGQGGREAAGVGAARRALAGGGDDVPARRGVVGEAVELDAGQPAPDEFVADRVEDGVGAVGGVGGVAVPGPAVGAREHQDTAGGAQEHTRAEPFGVLVRDRVRHLDRPAGGRGEVHIDPAPAARGVCVLGAVGQFGVAAAGAGVGERAEPETGVGERRSGAVGVSVEDQAHRVGDGPAFGAAWLAVAGVGAESGGEVGDPALQRDLGGVRTLCGTVASA